VHGNIAVPERCELHSGSQLIGDLQAVRVALEDGATFLGKLEVTPNNAAIKDVAVAQNREPQKLALAAKEFRVAARGRVGVGEHQKVRVRVDPN